MPETPEERNKPHPFLEVRLNTLAALIATGLGRNALSELLREAEDEIHRLRSAEAAAREECIRAIRRLQDGEVRGYDSILDDAINAIRALAGKKENDGISQ